MELDAAVYTFLVRCGHAKAAETFLRETKRKEPSLSSSKLDLCEIFATHQKQQKQSASSQVLQQQKRKQPAPSTTAPAASTSKKLKVESDSEDSDDSDDSDDDSDSDSSDSSSEDSEEERKTLLKRMEVKEAERKARAEEAAKAAAKWAENASPSFPVKSKGAKGPRVSGEAFKRVDAEVWSKEIIEGLEDNSYEKAFGVDGYGAKASAVLMTVRGKAFQHEKTKKKRGSYRGGEITLASNSFKYDD